MINSNLFQTILTVMLTVTGIATSVLLNMGCHDVSGTINCVGSTAPSWLLPYLGIIATALGILKLIIAALTGKLVKPTAVIATNGAVGTVHPTDVVK